MNFRFFLFVLVATFASGCLFPKLGPALQESWCAETHSWGSCVEPVHTQPYHPVGCNIYPGDFPESPTTRGWQAEAARLFDPETIPDTPECREWLRRNSYDHLRLSEDGSNAQARRRAE